MEGYYPPEEWLVSQICEEFLCTPAEAIEQPLALTLDVMDLRRYARAKDRRDRNQKEGKIEEDDKALELVKEIEERAVVLEHQANMTRRDQ